METIKLGELITSPQERDAVHIAIAPVIAGEKLKPGQHVGFSLDYEKSNRTVMVVTNPVGIIDPLLKKPVQIGQECWLWLYPNTVTSLKHNWTHPAFPKSDENQPKNSVSEQYMRDLADSVGISYQRLLDGAASYVNSKKESGWGDYIVGGSEMEGMSVPQEFWEHYEKVTGRTVEEANRGSFFSCSC